MSDQWMQSLDLPMTPDEFRRVPRSATHSYAYYDGRAWISPRPRFYNGLLDLPGWEADLPADDPIRPVDPGDWPRLAEAFADAFSGQEPLATRPPEERLRAADEILHRTRAGGDGPFAAEASFVAEGPGGLLLGATLITLVPRGDLGEWGSCLWPEPPPEDLWESRGGRPHLTWAFVRRMTAGGGVGTALLAATVSALLGAGYQELASTFLAGNDASMLWHWRNGFRLARHPGSMRRHRGGE